MTSPSHPKPIPARLPEPETSGAQVVPGAEGKPDPTPPAAEPEETTVDEGGKTWWVRVIGRSGRSDGRSPPLVLLGFWETAAGGTRPDREALVAGRSLAQIDSERLLRALAESAPPTDGRRKPFFEGVPQGRRGGGGPSDG